MQITHGGGAFWVEEQANGKIVQYGPFKSLDEAKGALGRLSKPKS